jgi:WXXGXW repeat (2 copies)
VRIFRLLLVAVAALALAFPTRANAQVYISLLAPPPLPYYTQPALTQPNAIWTPGYWAWGPAGYYWVPGTWTTPPQTGLYWTPGYWGMNTGGAGYMWNPGYWGQNVGYYGGINYGYGYYGNGYAGGQWYGPQFRYNTAVSTVNPTYVRNVYVNRTVVVRTVNHYSYNGPGGIRMHPTQQQIAYSKERRIEMTPAQRTHVTEAREDRNMYANVNHGKPAQAAVAKPFSATNRPANFKPVTAADKEAANKQVQMHKAPSTQMKPAAKPPTSTEHKAPATTEHKPAPKPAAKPPTSTEHKPPATSTQHKPAPVSKPPSANKPPEKMQPQHSAQKPPSGQKPQSSSKQGQKPADSSKQGKPPAIR